MSARSERRGRRCSTGWRAEHPDARIALDYTTPLELLVATILSAQCTDARVNLVTPELFRALPHCRRTTWRCRAASWRI